ncbi:septum site-determining protein Ssd [Nocardioides ferulae]|uniref:septum site-determining protein Ssd n=1 Tax=Nocardioides ferulae TaxID=2340821 RepID=UPI000EAD4571|nr:septum site-determining protein Ssd [Nocardioides ferulae]
MARTSSVSAPRPGPQSGEQPEPSARARLRPGPAGAPLVVTRDESLLDELLRLAAAAGVTPELVSDGGAALRPWASAPLVLVGADLAGEVGALAPARRSGVFVVGWAPVPQETFRHALEVGAESIVDLPGSTVWLSERLTDLDDDLRRPGRMVGVVGGSGGAGASTFACALGQVAAREGATLVVDADPWGPGLDRMLGLEDLDGIRWDALHHATGRVSARSLREALPRRGSLGVLTFQAGAASTLSTVAARDTLAAARRGHDVVVVDLPRSPDPLVREVVDRCDALLVVVAPTLVGVASAARLSSRLGDAPGARLVLRGRGVAEHEVAAVTGLPVAATMPDQRGLAEALDLGLGPVRSRRGPLARAAATVLAGLGPVAA